MIRKVYTNRILRKLREDGPSWLLKRCRQCLLLQLSRNNRTISEDIMTYVKR